MDRKARRPTSKLRQLISFLTTLLLSVARRERTSLNISSMDVDGAEVALVEAKYGIGKTGVHFRFYESEEFQDLSSEQREERRAQAMALGKP